MFVWNIFNFLLVFFKFLINKFAANQIYGKKYSGMDQVKFVKDGLQKILKRCLNRPYYLKMFKGCLPRIFFLVHS